MLLNYLKIAFRNPLKNNLFFTINIMVTPISLASAFVISLFIDDELIQNE